MDPGAILTYPNAEGHIEMSGLVLATLHAVSVVDVFNEQLIDELCLLGRLALVGRWGRRDDWSLDEWEVRVRSGSLMRQLLGSWDPGRLLPLRHRYGLCLRRGL